MKLFKTCLIATLILTQFIALPVVNGQSSCPYFPTGGVTGNTVVALNDNTTTVSTTYYAEDGTQYTLMDQVLTSKGDSYTYFNEPQEASYFSGSTISSADRTIGNVVNTNFSSNWSQGVYNSLPIGSINVVLPLVTKCYFGITSAIAVQNTDTANTLAIEIEYTSQDGSTFVKTYYIQPGASQIIDIGVDSDFNQSWIGSAVVTPQDGSTPITAAVINYSDSYVFAYSGIMSTSTINHLPLIRSGFGGLATGIQIRDVSAGGDETVTINYNGFADINNNYIKDSGEEYTCAVQATIPDGNSINIVNTPFESFNTIYGGDGTATIVGGDCQVNGHNNFNDAGGAFLGSAEVVSTGEIATVVNDIYINGFQGSAAYTGFIPTQADSELISFFTRSNYYGYTTGTQIQNISGSSVSLTATFNTLSGSQNQNTPPDMFVTLAAGETHTFYLPMDWPGEEGWIGSMIVNVDGGSPASLIGLTVDIPINGSDFNNFELLTPTSANFITYGPFVLK